VAEGNPFHVECMIAGVVQPGVYVVELSNGHRLVGYAVRRDREWAMGLKLGERVTVECSPYDLSKGRLRPL